MLNEEQKYLIRELNSYNYLHQKLCDMTEAYAHSMRYIDEKIKEIDEQLNDYHVPGISYDTISVRSVPTSKNSRVLELINEQDNLKKRKARLKVVQEKEVEKLTSRIDDVNSMINNLDKWEFQFIWDMYIVPKGIDFMQDNYHYSRANVFKKATSLLKKMLKK